MAVGRTHVSGWACHSRTWRRVDAVRSMLASARGQSHQRQRVADQAAHRRLLRDDRRSRTESCLSMRHTRRERRNRLLLAEFRCARSGCSPADHHTRALTGGALTSSARQNVQVCSGESNVFGRRVYVCRAFTNSRALTAIEPTTGIGSRAFWSVTNHRTLISPQASIFDLPGSCESCVERLGRVM